MTRVMSRTSTFLLMLVILAGVRLAGDAPAQSLYEIVDLGRGSAILINERGDVVIRETTLSPFADDAVISSYFWTEAGGRIPIPGASSQTFATGLNPTGQVVGYTGYPSFFGIVESHYDAFSWTAESGTTLIPGYSAIGCGTASSFASAVNVQGELVGTVEWSCKWAGDGRFAFLWSAASGMHQVAGLGGWATFGRDVNDHGHVVGTSYLPDRSDLYHAFLSTAAGGSVDLGTLGGASSEAIAVNNNGEVTGAADRTTGLRTAFFWRVDTGMVDLGSLGGANSTAAALNDFGQIVGDSVRADGRTHAFAWTLAGGMIDLGTLGGDASHATVVNTHGHVVGYSERGDGSSHAFVWTPGTGMIDLGTLGGSTSAALAVNGRGEIVGWSTLAGSEVAHAVLWRPIGVEQILSNLIAGTAAARFQQGASLLRNALSTFNRDHLGAACNQVSAFMHQVSAQSGKSLPAVQAGEWLASATQVKAIAGCP